MSTTINVTVGGNGLLDQSRQQMQANRFGRLERDQDRKTEEQTIEQQNTAQQTDQIGRPLQSRRLRDQPAAWRAGGYDFGFITYTRSPDRLYAMDGSGSLLMASSARPNFFSRPQTIYKQLKILDYYTEDGLAAYRNVLINDTLQLALPIGGQSAIFIDGAQLYQSYATAAYVGDWWWTGIPPENYVNNYFDQTQNYYQIDCYYVSASTVRQVPLPSALSYLLRSYVMPEVSLDYTIQMNFDGDPIAKTYFAKSDPFVRPNGLFERYGLISSAGQAQVFSPGIYSFLANAQQCVADNQSNNYNPTNYTYFNGITGPVSYAKKHLYASLNYLRNDRMAFEWTAVLPADLNAFPSDPFLPPEYIELDSRFRRTRLKKTVPPRPVQSDYFDILFWDGGNPSYCRQQLISLGFREEDLMP